MIAAPETISTKRLLLRRPLASDAVAVFEYAYDVDVTRYMDWPRQTEIRNAEEFLTAHEARWSSGEEFCWMITISNNGKTIGAIACRIRDDDADFGYVLNRNFWGRGFASEAAIALVSWLCDLPNIGRVWATCDAENIASAHVLEKAGLIFEELKPHSKIRPNLSNEPRDTLVFAKVLSARLTLAVPDRLWRRDGAAFWEKSS